jgi:predicted ester cyclase
MVLLIIAMLSLFLTYYFWNKFMVTNRNKEIVIKLLEEVWNNHNYKMIDELIATQYTIRHDPGDQWEGKALDLDTYKRRVQFSHYIFPDQKFFIEDIVSDDDKVVVSWHFTGTQKGDLPNLTATNKKVNVSGITFYYLSNGKIIGHWQVIDNLGFLWQIGIQISKDKSN